MVILEITYALFLMYVLFATGCRCADAADGQPSIPPAKGLYLFISASLPEQSLRTIATEAAPTQIPLLLRGLVGASLQETLGRMKAVTEVGAALEIDPLLFEAYGIEAVPAVVLTCGARGEGPFAVVYGIGVSQALPILHKQLSCAPTE